LEALESRWLPSACVVDNLGDTGSGSGGAGDLRYCITRANTLGKADAAPETITFAVQGVINLGGALPDLASDMDILGPGPNALTVRRNTPLGYYRIFTIGAGARVRISGLTATNGSFSYYWTGGGGDGGGIYNKGTLTLEAVRITGNHAARVGSGDVGSFTNALGGGIYNKGSLVIEDSSISGNSVYGADYWGSVYGGGIYTSGPLTIINSEIAGNYAKAEDSSDYPDPVAFGGGVDIDAKAITVTIDNSTIANNTLYGDWTGGSGISAFYWGTSAVTVTHSTIASNTNGSGVYTDDHLTLGNSIVANNGPQDVEGAITSSGYNLIGNSAGGSGYAPSDLLDVDPKLGPLQDNGGPTQTMALLSGSPAIDSGTNQMAPEWDQRGPGYPRVVNGTIDRGAFEVQNSTGPAVVPGAVGTEAFPAMAKPSIPQAAPAQTATGCPGAGSRAGCGREASRPDPARGPPSGGRAGPGCGRARPGLVRGRPGR
jgi:hypothetical protein